METTKLNNSEVSMDCNITDAIPTIKEEEVLVADFTNFLNLDSYEESLKAKAVEVDSNNIKREEVMERVEQSYDPQQVRKLNTFKDKSASEIRADQKLRPSTKISLINIKEEKIRVSAKEQRENRKRLSKKHFPELGPSKAGSLDSVFEPLTIEQQHLRDIQILERKLGDANKEIVLYQENKLKMEEDFKTVVNKKLELEDENWSLKNKIQDLLKLDANGVEELEVTKKNLDDLVKEFHKVSEEVAVLQRKNDALQIKIEKLVKEKKESIKKNELMTAHELSLFTEWMKIKDLDDLKKKLHGDLEQKEITVKKKIDDLEIKKFEEPPKVSKLEHDIRGTPKVNTGTLDVSAEKVSDKTFTDALLDKNPVPLEPKIIIVEKEQPKIIEKPVEVGESSKVKEVKPQVEKKMKKKKLMGSVDSVYQTAGFNMIPAMIRSDSLTNLNKKRFEPNPYKSLPTSIWRAKCLKKCTIERALTDHFYKTMYKYRKLWAEGGNNIKMNVLYSVPDLKKLIFGDAPKPEVIWSRLSTWETKVKGLEHPSIRNWHSLKVENMI